MRRVLELDHAVIPFFDRCQANGLPVDRPGCAALAVEMRQKKITIRDHLAATLGYYCNPNSADQVRAVLKAVLPHEIIDDIDVFTDLGEISTGKKVIEALRGQHPAIDDIISYRQHTKVEGYAENLATEIDPPPPAEPQRARSNIRITRVASGRVSASQRDEGGVSLLTLPVRTELGRRVRKQFKVQVPGRVLLAVDESQVELRVCAHLSEDREMIRLFHAGADLHIFTAMKIFGLANPADVDKHKHRGPAKNAGFGILYGITAKGLLDQMRINGQGHLWDEESCQKLLDEWFKVFPGVEKYIAMARQRVSHLGYAEDMCGRRRLLPGAASKLPWIQQEAWRQAVSLEIQGSAQAILKEAMAELWPILVDHWRWPGSKYFEPVLQVHDELMFEGDEADAAMWLTTLKCAMTTTTQLRVPLESSGGMATDWGSLER